MKTKFQIKSIYGNLLFEYEDETLKDAVEAAVQVCADLRSADLSGADLSGAKGVLPIVPEEGSFIGFKKLANDTIAKLYIPEDAERVGGYTGRKCRASKAIVIEGSGPSKYDSSFTYEPGKTVIPAAWDNDPRVECSSGIHFFITRKEAEEYE